MLTPTGGRVRRVPVAALALLLLATLLGCSDDAPGRAGNGDDATTTSTEQIPTRTTIGTVAGRLNGKRRRQLERRVTEVFDQWLDAAFVGGEYPRTDFSDVFGVFTQGAAARARRDRALLSNAGVGDRVDSVRATRRRLWLDVLAPEGTPVGVTARFVLVLDLAGEVERTDRIAGRLVLRYVQGGWKAFGYDVQRGAV